MKYSLKTIKECDISSYEICISCSFFKMNNAYRKTTKYLEYFNKWFPIIPKSSYVRMYVDESILEDKDFIKLFNKNYKKLEIVFFEFEDFKNGVYHDGTFGSIIRFLPLFNKPALPKNIKYIWINTFHLLK